MEPIKINQSDCEFALLQDARLSVIGRLWIRQHCCEDRCQRFLAATKWW